MPKLNASALKFIILLGFVSLCADATYEGARSITGAYLGGLGLLLDNQNYQFYQVSENFYEIRGIRVSLAK